MEVNLLFLNKNWRWEWHVGVACGSGKEQHFKSKVWNLVAELKALPGKYQPPPSQSYRSQQSR